MFLFFFFVAPRFPAGRKRCGKGSFEGVEDDGAIAWNRGLGVGVIYHPHWLPAGAGTKEVEHGYFSVWVYGALLR